MSPKLGGLFDGFSFTVCAYGISGSGKTHTIFGSHKQTNIFEEGLLLQTAYELFAIKEKKGTKNQIEVRVSMLEIYNEHVHDLLSGDSGVKKNLQLIENPISNGVIVQDLTNITIKSCEELKLAVARGLEGRVIAASSNNMHSSRSHVITDLAILSTDKNDNESKMLSKVRFVD